MNSFNWGIVNNVGSSANKNYLTFSSSNPFSISFTAKHWDGVLEYSTDTQNWTEWDASEIYSVSNKIYLRGTGNSYITGIGAISDPSYAIQINATSGVACAGNIMTLLDHMNPDNAVLGAAAFAYMFYGCTSLTVAPELPATQLADYCYTAMFYDCTSLTVAPELPATTLAAQCYANMFYYCESLTEVPELPATTLARYCYTGMFSRCTGIKISETQTGIYQKPWRLPTVGTGTTATGWSNGMLSNTGGTFTGYPAINTTYYQAG